jgi:hypothetical protein
VLNVFLGFLLALFLTIFIESIIVFLFGFRVRTFFLGVLAINFVTNPALNYSILVIQSLTLLRIGFWVLLFFEIIVVFVEWRLLAFTSSASGKKLLLLSTVMNLCSFALGLVIFSFV